MTPVWASSPLSILTGLWTTRLGYTAIFHTLTREPTQKSKRWQNVFVLLLFIFLSFLLTLQLHASYESWTYISWYYFHLLSLGFTTRMLLICKLESNFWGATISTGYPTHLFSYLRFSKRRITIYGITLVEEDRVLIDGFNSVVVQLHADHLKYLT